MTDPHGLEWDVSRNWLTLPRWSRRPMDDGIDLGGVPADLAVGDDSLLGIIVGVLLVLAAAIVLWFLLPVAIVLLGLVVALVGLGARLASITSWEVVARSGPRTLRWHVRGPFRSRRAMHHVAAALARGDDPLVEGRRGAPDGPVGGTTLEP